MEAKEIENLISVCTSDIAEIDEKTLSLNMIDGIVGMRKYHCRFNYSRYNYEIQRNADVMLIYDKLRKGTLEGQMSELGITLFTIANKYNLDMRSLHVDGDLSKTRNLDTLMIAMIKIVLSEYNMAKKIIILIGMLMCYCLREKIDILFFIKKRLLLNG